MLSYREAIYHSLVLFRSLITSHCEAENAKESLLIVSMLSRYVVRKSVPVTRINAFALLFFAEKNNHE